MEPKSLVEHLSEIEDPRRAGYAHRHDLVEILVIAVCAMCCDVEGFEEMEDWARAKEPWLRRFLKLDNGIASHDTFRRVFALLDPQALEKAFRAWVGSVLGAFGQVAIDGKALRGSADADSAALHMVSAFATELGLVLGQEAVADKSNEITAIPVLLEALDIKGCLVSIDAMGTQHHIASTILSQGANYLLTVKNNQPALRAALEDAFTDTPMHGYEQVQREHGRIVVQHAQIIANTGQVDPAHWPDCKSLGRAISLREEGKKPQSLETRYYISSAQLDHQAFQGAVRDHWAIENKLHWSLDVTFAEDASKVRKDHAPRNLSLLRKIILNLLRYDTAHPKASLKRRRKMAGWDDDERMRLLGIKPL